MTRTWPALFQPVLTKLAADGYRYFGSKDIQLEPVRQLDRPFSTVLKVRVADRQGSQSAFIKILKPRFDTPAEIAATRQHVRSDFDTMCRIQDALARSQRLDVVRPIACFPEDLALVTGEAVGPTLGTMLAGAAAGWRRGSALADALQALTQVGAWLKAVQSALPQQRDVELSRIRAYVSKRLDDLQSMGTPCLTGAGRQALERYQEALIATIGRERVSAVWIHADFCPENIIVHDGRITVLDFVMANTGTVYHDLAHLYLHIEAIAAKPWCRPSAVRTLQRELLAGFEAGLEPGRPLFALVLYQHVLCQMLLLQNGAGGRLARLYGAGLHARHRRWLSEVAGLDGRDWA